VLLTASLLLLSHRVHARLADLGAVTEQAVEIGDEIQAMVSSEFASIVAFQTTQAPQDTETYQTDKTGVQARMKRLQQLLPFLGSGVQARFQELQSAIETWHRDVAAGELSTRLLPPGGFRRRVFDRFSDMKRARDSTNLFNRSVLEYQSTERARVQRMAYLFMALAVILGPLALFALILMMHVVRGQSMTTSHLETRAREEEALRQVGQSLTGGLTVDDVLGRVVEAVVYSELADDVFIETVDAKLKDVTCVAGSSRSILPKGTRSPYTGSLAQIVVQGGQPRIITNIDLEDQQGSVFRDLIRGSDNRSAMVIPLISQNRPLGAMCLMRGAENAFTYAEVPLARILADMASIALQRARTVEQLQALEDEERVLVEVSATLASSLDYRHTLETVAQLAVSHMGDWCIVHLVERQRVYHAEVGYADPGKGDLARRLREKHRARPDLTISVENVIRTGEAFLYAEFTPALLREYSVDEEHFELLRQTDPKSAMFVPLTAGVETFGALVFLTSGSRRYDEDDLRRAVNMGRRDALAIHNAQLYAVANEAIQLRESVLRMVAHDLRNPLNAIQLSARMLAEPALPYERYCKLLQSITGASARMNRLIDDLLIVGRIAANQTIPLELHDEDPVDIVEQVCDMMGGQARAQSVDLRCGTTNPPVPSVMADRARILQVLTNLADNALKFTPRGGSVSVSCERFDQGVRFAVTDTGRGIEPEHLAKIFDPFWQASETAHLGSGLGLPIAKAIVEQHHGRIWVESKPGTGTTVTFTLPLAHVEEAGSRTAGWQPVSAQ
jgi:signal transduction histidine kinase